MKLIYHRHNRTQWEYNRDMLGNILRLTVGTPTALASSHGKATVRSRAVSCWHKMWIFHSSVFGVLDSAGCDGLTGFHALDKTSRSKLWSATNDALDSSWVLICCAHQKLIAIEHTKTASWRCWIRMYVDCPWCIPNLADCIVWFCAGKTMSSSLHGWRLPYVRLMHHFPQQFQLVISPNYFL